MATADRPEIPLPVARGTKPPAKLDILTMIGFAWRWCTIHRKRSGLFTGPFFSPPSSLGWFF